MIGPDHDFWKAHEKIVAAGHHPFGAVFLTDHELRQIKGFTQRLHLAWRSTFAPFLERNARYTPEASGRNRARWVLAGHIAHARRGQ